MNTEELIELESYIGYLLIEAENEDDGYSTLFESALEATKHDSAIGNFAVGWLYRSGGEGAVEIDLEKSKLYTKKAASLGHIEAMIEAEMYTENTVEIAAYMKIAIENLDEEIEMWSENLNCITEDFDEKENIEFENKYRELNEGYKNNKIVFCQPE